MTERIPKSVWIAAAALGPLVLAYLAYSRPGYFISQTYLGGLLLLEFLAAAVWMYRRVFFPLVIMAFLLAGVDVPVGHFWTAVRWVFLCVGALAGSVIMLKERRYHFGLFHVLATFAVLATLVSAAVSQYPNITLLKALSLLLLFLYGSTGARLAVTGRENRFFAGLLLGCEVFVGAVAAFYVVGIGVMGNPNSLGAVMGVVGAPILLWGTLVSEKPSDRRRRMVLYAISMYLTFASHARAGMVAALISSALLCLTLRKYKFLARGVVVVAVLFAATSILQPETFSNTVSSVIYKGDPEHNLLSSRQSPWESAVDRIRSHFWFGTGLGTIENAEGTNVRVGMFASSTDVTTENGSSYLSVMAGVGVCGAVPFSLLLILLLVKVFRTVGWMIRTGRANHAAVPLAAVIVAGMTHAGFEDWLFASGYYLCVMFWTLAFILVDVAPSSLPRIAFAWRFRATQGGFGDVAPSR
jgi:O-antigen ligase